MSNKNKKLALVLLVATPLILVLSSVLFLGLNKEDKQQTVKSIDKYSLGLNKVKKIDLSPNKDLDSVRLSKEDVVVGMDVLSGNEQLLVIMENGYGKRTESDQFTAHHRGGSGIKAGVITAKTGKAVDVRVIDKEAKEIMIISKSGVVIRLQVKSISKISRATQGVRIMKLTNNDSVASVALIATANDDA